MLDKIKASKEKRNCLMGWCTFLGQTVLVCCITVAPNGIRKCNNPFG